uniref:Mannosylglycerate hydrolase MGH1-like glycoside hydrolase domain-containing protein n=1 Tax=Aureoumbra lagunensis TaxID=44058 RepID=A0A7S3NGC0_9STRA|mmetsp:Transcript_16602/g.24939  ORF Transcript_16602/g.24939 Transcript_16602/m.24939 type:complete len:560 (-) Transcript_16602:90-1769(-)
MFCFLIAKIIFSFLIRLANTRWLSATEVSRLEAEGLWVLLKNYDSRIGVTKTSGEDQSYISSMTSSIVALALARHAPISAMQELSRVLSYQRPSGLIPAFILTGDPSRVTIIQESGIQLPSVAFFWNTTTPALAALPIHAAIALKIYEACPDRRRAGLWAVEIAPKLKRYHEYLHRQRTLPNSNLVRLVHPWETSALRSNLKSVVPLNSTNQDTKTLNDLAANPDAQLQLARCLIDTEDDSVTACSFVAIDVEFNAILALSEAALTELCRALERRKLPRPHDYQGDISDYDLNALWTFDGYRSRYSIINKVLIELNHTIISAIPLLADLAPLLLSSLSPEKRDPLVGQLLLKEPAQKGETSFACFGSAPFPDLACHWTGSELFWYFDAVTRPIGNFFVERGLRHSRQDALADWLRDSTLFLLHQQTSQPPMQPPPLECWKAREEAQKQLFSENFIDENDTSIYSIAACALPDLTQAFFPCYNQLGIGFGNNRSALSAAVAVALITPDATFNDYPDAPVSRSMLFTLIAFELGVAFLVAVTCFTTNLLMIRALGSNDGEK